MYMIYIKYRKQSLNCKWIQYIDEKQMDLFVNFAVMYKYNKYEAKNNIKIV